MALFEQFPYTNFHEMNLDWLLQRVKALEIIASDDDLVVFKETNGTYTKIMGKTASQLYDEVKAGNKVQAMLIGNDLIDYKVEYAVKVTAGKIMNNAFVKFIFAPEIAESLSDPGILTISHNRIISMTQAMPSDTVSYSQTDSDVAMEV